MYERLKQASTIANNQKRNKETQKQVREAFLLNISIAVTEISDVKLAHKRSEENPERRKFYLLLENIEKNLSKI